MAFDEFMVFYVLVFDGFGELMVLDELTFSMSEQLSRSQWFDGPDECHGLESFDELSYE